MITDHESGMARAVALGRRNPAAPFGALIVAAGSGEILADGVNAIGESPTRHGEVVAIDVWAASGAKRSDGPLVLYTTAEPCPMCMSAILWAGIEIIVFGTSIPTLVRKGWRQIDIRAAEVASRAPFASCTIIGGVHEAECDLLFCRTTPAPARVESSEDLTTAAAEERGLGRSATPGHRDRGLGPR